MAFIQWKPDRLFDGLRFYPQDTVLVTRDDGTIEDIIPVAAAGTEIRHVGGILSPGLINCHCHLELSHLKNVIPPHTGLIEFLCSVVTKRGFSQEIIQQEIEKAEKEMFDNGIVAVGDIGNTADTARVKKESGIRWQNFTEVLSFTDEKAEENMHHYSEVAAALREALASARTSGHRTSLVPHAPYSISPRTFELLNEATAGQVISIHNQEHPAEDELYRTGGGDYLKLFSIFGIHTSPFPVTGKSSIRSVLPHFNKQQTILLVHNSYMPEEDVQWANAYAASAGIQLVYCICINANLYIENHTPPLDMLLRNNCSIVLGTDSYSSNWQLSIAREVAAIRKHFPAIPEETILHWATGGGATALGWQDKLGYFRKGMRPGLTSIDTESGVSKRIE